MTVEARELYSSSMGPIVSGSRTPFRANAHRARAERSLWRRIGEDQSEGNGTILQPVTRCASVRCPSWVNIDRASQGHRPPRVRYAPKATALSGLSEASTNSPSSVTEEHNHGRHYRLPASDNPTRIPWDKRKLTGAKPPLRQKHVWAIRTKLQIEQRARDLAMFNLAIDSKLRGCDVVALRVEDVAPNGYSIDRATVPPGGRRVSQDSRQEARGVPIHRPAWPGPMHDHPAIRAAFVGVDRQHRARPASVRHPFAETDEGHAATAGPVICEPCSYCSVIPRSRAQSGISALRLMTPFLSRNRSTSDLPGRSWPASPVLSPTRTTPPKLQSSIPGHLPKSA
jgi:hypothetical protein